MVNKDIKNMMGWGVEGVETAHRVKVFATKPGIPSSIPGTDMVERENRALQML